MHFVCLVASDHCPGEAEIDDLLWPWCVSNEERREPRFDYCEIGGRFADFFSLEETRPAAEDVADRDAKTWDVAGPGNQLRKRDLPFDRLAERAATRKADLYDKVQRALTVRRFGWWAKQQQLPDLASLRARHGFAKARDIFQADPAVRSVRRAIPDVLMDDDIAEFALPREQVVSTARRRAIETFAFVTGDRWLETKESILTPEAAADWEREFAQLLDAVDPDWWLTAVDCHR